MDVALWRISLSCLFETLSLNLVLDLGKPSLSRTQNLNVSYFGLLAQGVIGCPFLCGLGFPPFDHVEQTREVRSWADLYVRYGLD